MEKEREGGGKTGHANGVYGLAALARGPVEHAVCVCGVSVSMAASAAAFSRPVYLH